MFYNKFTMEQISSERTHTKSMEKPDFGYNGSRAYSEQLKSYKEIGRPTISPELQYTCVGYKWVDNALCRIPENSHYFSLPNNEGSIARRRRISIAKSICTICPVNVECQAITFANYYLGPALKRNPVEIGAVLAGMEGREIKAQKKTGNYPRLA